MQRPDIQEECWAEAIATVVRKLSERRSEYGDGSMLSRHEIRGVVDEEVSELDDAVRSNSLAVVREELVDIAVAAILGIASIDSNEVQW